MAPRTARTVTPNCELSATRDEGARFNRLLDDPKGDLGAYAGADGKLAAVPAHLLGVLVHPDERVIGLLLESEGPSPTALRRRSSSD